MISSMTNIMTEKLRLKLKKLEQTIWALWVMDATPATFEFAKEELNTNKNKYILKTY